MSNRSSRSRREERYRDRTSSAERVAAFRECFQEAECEAAREQNAERVVASRRQQLAEEERQERRRRDSEQIASRRAIISDDKYQER